MTKRKPHAEIIKQVYAFEPIPDIYSVLVRNLLTRAIWRKEQGYIYSIHQSRIYFLSGQPTANVVGATANLLLACDE